MFASIAAIVLALASAAAAERAYQLPLGIEPVPAINATKYLGRWYQIASSLTVNASFEAGTVCVAANYDINPNGTIGVHNVARKGDINGPPSDIDGWAQAENQTAPAALTVHLQGVPVPAPYWIVLLGEPETPDGVYTYSIVSDPFELSLFVLARDIDEFNTKYKAEVYAKLDKLGFNEVWNTPLPTLQAGCW